MTTRLLFPYRFRLIGWLIFVPFALLGLAYLYADFQLDWLVIPRLNKLTRIVTSMSETNLTEVQNLTDEVAGIGVIAGLLLIAFSKEKTEDEMSTVLRLEALQWSVYANYLVLTVAILLVYGEPFFNVMIYNMFTLLLVFIARYRWLVWQTNSALSV
jgi:hypothetical protein